MKKKKLVLFGAAAVAALSLASCGESKDTPKEYTGTKSNSLDIYINYNQNSGISYVKEASYLNPVENKTYNQGDLLPSWKEFQSRLAATAKTTDNYETFTLRDASSYGVSGDKNTYTAVKGTNYKSETNNAQQIDLFYNSTANINTMGDNGEAINLRDYLDFMPNFKAFLAKYPEIEAEISRGSSKAIYFTPYLDGYNTVERQYVMDTELVANLLDKAVDSTLGTIPAGVGGNAKTIQVESADKLAQPFMDANNNYPTDNFELKVLDGDTVKTVKVKQTTNIIKQQNQLLGAGTTGAALLSQFKTYLATAYPDYANKLSEIFTGTKAIYNADDMVALMRVVKANPDVIYGSATQWDEVECLFPRGQDNSRINNMLNFAATLYGVQGFGAEKDHLYYTADGKLNDAETTQASYDLLDKMAALYDEGLIMDDFYLEGSKAGKEYVNRYFAKTVDGKSSYGLIMYDYSATQSVVNDLSNGLGTDPAKRTGTNVEGFSFKDKSFKGIMPILAPYTYWATESGWNHNAVLGSTEDRAKKTVTRYYEENRAVKTNSWCIPSNSDNVFYALKLMDDMYSEEGNKLQNFGPSNYYTMGTFNGESTPVLTQAVWNAFQEKKGDVWDFFRQVMGTTQGIGHYRPTALDYQSTNSYAQVGYNNLAKAISKGVQGIAKLSTSGISWDTTVRTSCYPTIDTTTGNKYLSLTDFWLSSNKRSSSAKGWIKLVLAGGTSYTGTIDNDGSNDYTLATIKGQFTIKNTTYLYQFANSIGKSYIPTYAVE